MEPKSDRQDGEVVKERSSKVPLYTIALAIAAVSIFKSGWLVGTGRLNIRLGNGIMPVVDSGSSKAPTDGINELYSQIKNNYDGDISDEQFLEGIKDGLADAVGDPFTEYLSAKETKDFNDGLNGTFEGIGAELGKEGNAITIVAPIKGMPAEKAGLQPKDIIVEIDGESALDISITEAVSRIRGPKGEKVTLGIIRSGKELSVEIIRDTIEIASVEWQKDGDVGIITITRFGDDTVAMTEKAAGDLAGQGAKKIILDMRGNPGGLLDAAVGVASVWLPKGSTVLEEKRGGQIVKAYTTSKNPVFKNLSTVVLINAGSASASEIVAGALRDNKVATVVGETSYGKGSVQRLIPLSNGDSLKVTIARWFTPSGVSIDKEGIKPDHEVARSPEDAAAGRDPQLDRARELLKN